jgi:2-polyprenyl-3-methyl-5-hydroxy-6-metoxy-1,4-benzoquinol methylase/glycosyltransferase involved in cell wall biosynthesis
MRVLVDCIPLNVGGGIQVSIAFLLGLQARADIAWKAVVPAGLKPSMPPELASDARMMFLPKGSTLDRVLLSRKLRIVESEFVPDVVFTVFGPAVFRTRAPHLVGFALPHLIYDVDCDAVMRRGMERLRDALQRVALRRSDHLVVETHTVRRRLAERLGIDPARISVIPNGVNPLIAAHAADGGSPGARPARRKPGLRRPGVLIPSAHYPHKNLEIVPLVAAAMCQFAPDLDVEFRFTLDPASAAWRRLKSEAARSGVADMVVTLNVLRLPELAHAYRAATAVLLPTLREASTAVYPESFALERPVVTSDLDFARELCGDAALFVPPHDAAAIAAGLIDLFRSPQLRQRLVEAGRKRLAANYPGPDEKFAMQLDLLTALSRDRRQSVRPANPVTTEPVTTDEASSAPRERSTGRPPAGSSAASGNPTVAFHGSVATDWDAKYRSGGFRRRADFFRREILPVIARHGHWLDAGCGSGYFARVLAAQGLRVTGVDASAPMIAAAGRLACEADLPGALNFAVIRDVARLPFADNSFAGCLCLSVLEYVDEPRELLNELARVIEPGGMLVLSVPSRYSAMRFIEHVLLRLHVDLIISKLQYRNLSRFSPAPWKLREALSQRGFEVKKIAPFDPVLPAALMPAFAASLLFAVATKAA